jgi:hypothetical protein
MLMLLIIAVIIGVAVSGLAGIGLLGLIAGGAFFLFGLPGALATSFIHGEVSYAQDRADYRQQLSDLAAMETAEDYELAEDERTDRIIEAMEEGPRCIVHDNRQVHFHASAYYGKEE